MHIILLRNVSEELYRRIRVTAAEEGVSVPKLILRVLDEYTKGVRVERKKRKGGKR